MSESEPNPYAPPTPDISEGPQEPANLGARRGARLAGAFMLADAAVLLVALVRLNVNRSPLTIALDVAAGTMLLRWGPRFAFLALIRVGLEFALATIPDVGGRSSAFWGGGLWAIGLALLLIGRPETPRVVVGCVVCAVYLASGVLAIAFLMTGFI